jgi:putative chitobiose transport system permease protein
MRMRTSRGGRVLTAIVVIASVVVFALPIWWLVSASLDAQQGPGTVSLWPSAPTLDNYARAAELGFFSRAGVSLLVALLSVVLGLAVASAAAYAFTRWRTRLTSALFAVVVVSFLLPFEALSVPLAAVFGRVGLLDSIAALVIPGVANGLAIYNITQSYRVIPAELIEAAVLDGAGPFRVFRTLHLRLSGGAMVGSGVLIFGAQWNAYLWPLLVVTDDALKTGPIAVAANFTGRQAGYGVAFAEIVVLAIVPLVLLGLAQSRLTRGFLDSGLR